MPAQSLVVLHPPPPCSSLLVHLLAAAPRCRQRHHRRPFPSPNARSLPCARAAAAQAFGIPEEEELDTFFSCALRTKILVQGRLYLFRSMLCFYSNIFGFVTKTKLARRAPSSVESRSDSLPSLERFVCPLSFSTTW